MAEPALPFVGELIEVKAEEAQWRGAIERVLHGFALSILVDESNYAALSAHVNEVDLGRKLVYLRASRTDAAPAKALRPNSLVLKLNVKEGNFADWLRADLRQRFDYECVDSLRAFRAALERALTREGQVKHSRARHEKDDRSRIDERRNWLLGFDNREKLALYEQQERELRAKIGTLENQLAVLRNQMAERGVRRLHCQTLVNLQWQEIDVLPVAERIAAIGRQLKAIKEGNTALRKIDEHLRQQEKLVLEARDALRNEEVSQRQCERNIADHSQQLEALEQDPAIVPLTPLQQDGLDVRYAALPEPVRLKTLDGADRTVAKAINSEAEEISAGIADCVKFIEAHFATFSRNWRADADGLDASIEAAPDYFGKLVRLERTACQPMNNGFSSCCRIKATRISRPCRPTWPTRARGYWNAWRWSTRACDKFRSTRGRTSAPTCTSSPMIGNCRKCANSSRTSLSVLNNAWTDDPNWRKSVSSPCGGWSIGSPVRSRSTGAGAKRCLTCACTWSSLAGNWMKPTRKVEIYRSGAGKSGGQRQKLATTCLAAALRYQLGGGDSGVPMYAAVVLDEAFDKADNEFTALAMNIFANFGFQMIVATPLKSVMTLEPFIGGACFVDIRDRRVSGVLLIEYDEEAKRLKLPERSRQQDA